MQPELAAMIEQLEDAVRELVDPTAGTPSLL